MSKLILCTVGTSVFDSTKFVNSKDINRISKKIEEINDALKDPEASLDEAIKELASDKVLVEEMLAYLLGRLRSCLGGTREYQESLPAEISSLLAMGRYREEEDVFKYGPVTAEDHVWLLSSDSPEGAFSAYLAGALIRAGWLDGKIEYTSDDSVLKDFLFPSVPDGPREYEFHETNIKIKRISGLKISDTRTFRQGMESLKTVIYESVGKLSEVSHRLLNFTGGYKAVVPLANLLCWNTGFTTFYLHENGYEMILFEPPAGNTFSVSATKIMSIIEGSKSAGREGQQYKDHSQEGDERRRM
ncbi:MAG: hypothetical protein ACOWYE_09875 [Desulfatiglandales bacterium]